MRQGMTVAKAAATEMVEALPATPTTSLAAETEVLRQAHVALRDGNASRALALLDDWRAQHPVGALAEERTAARLIALCELGRDEGPREAAQFLSTRPSSLLAQRVAVSCGRSAPGR
jgi:hypothetical protein